MLVIGIIMGVSLSSKNLANKTTSNEYGKKMLDVLSIIETEYVDTVDKEALFEKTISDMLHKLDPHSNYIPAKDLKRMSESIQGQFGGIGVRFAIIRDTLCITNVIENAPAYFEGVKVFDQFIEVEGENIANVNLRNTQVQDLLKGEAGTAVEVTILRKGEKIKKSITRGMVPIKSVVASFMIDEKTGYIRLGQFSINSDKEFFNAVLDLQQKGMKKLVFDLRYNGGGVMSSAVNIADALLPQGVKIVSTKGKNRKEEIDFSRNPPLFKGLDLVVLVNQTSASASEIVAGAIQDNDRGVVVGRRTFGKGLVQQDIELKDGSNLRLTISRYYTPSGRCIQKPYSGSYEEYMMDEYTRYEKGELYEIDSSLFVDSLRYTTTNGRTVYGGGGIMPDIFVPLDTTGSSTYFRRLQYANVFSDFAYDYVRFTDMTRWADVEIFSKQFNVSNKMLNDFKKYAEEHYQVKPNEKGFNYSKSNIVLNIKSEIARQLWLENGSLYIRNKEDQEVLKGIEVFKKEL